MSSLRFGRPSSFLITKGALVQATYATFAGWDLARPIGENTRRLRNANYIGAPSNGWLKNFAKVITRRFDPQGHDRPLVELAKCGCDVEVWKPLLLWHMTRTDPIVHDFFVNWLFEQHSRGIQQVPADAARAYVKAFVAKSLPRDERWSEANLAASASGLLRMPVEFGLLKGTRVKRFSAYRLPDESFMYLLHAVLEDTGNGRKTIDNPDWRMFLMRPADVEAELYRLHQFRRIQFDAAGSLAQLTLPCKSAAEYARRLMS